MKWTWQRVTLAVVDGFAAASALFGGYAVTTGWITFPVALSSQWSWLVSDYFVPGLILGLVVGGTALAAFIATLFSRSAGAGFSVAAGLVMIGWIIGEVLIFPGLAWIQLFYALVGVGMVVLGMSLEPDRVRANAHRLHLV